MYTTYQQAISLKKLGYDLPCDAVYGYNCQEGYPQEIKERLVGISEISMTEGFEMCPEDLKNSNIGDDIAAPRLEDALEWFESEYGLVYDLCLDRTTEPKYAFEIYEYEYFGNYTLINRGEWFLYRTRKEATIEVLNAMINHITK